jgi:hypothetical protein
VLTLLLSCPLQALVEGAKKYGDPEAVRSMVDGGAGERLASLFAHCITLAMQLVHQPLVLPLPLPLAGPHARGAVVSQSLGYDACIYPYALQLSSLVSRIMVLV